MKTWHPIENFLGENSRARLYARAAQALLRFGLPAAVLNAALYLAWNGPGVFYAAGTISLIALFTAAAYALRGFSAAGRGRLDLAREIEREHPEFDDALSTYVEISQRGEPSEAEELLLERCLRVIQRIEAGKNRARAASVGWAAGVFLLLGMTLWMLASGREEPTRGEAVPSDRSPIVGVFPGDTVAYANAAVAITARITDAAADGVWLEHRRRGGGETVRVEMKPTSDGLFGAKLTPDFDTLYAVRTGRHVSREFTLRATRPLVEKIAAQVRLPRDAGGEPVVLSGSELEVPKGSALDIALDLGAIPASAEFRQNGGVIGFETSGQRLTLKFERIDAGGEIAYSITATSGQREDGKISIRLKKDRPPRGWLADDSRFECPLNGGLIFTAFAEDDTLVTGLRLEIRATSGATIGTLQFKFRPDIRTTGWTTFDPGALGIERPGVYEAVLTVRDDNPENEWVRGAPFALRVTLPITVPDGQDRDSLAEWFAGYAEGRDSFPNLLELLADLSRLNRARLEQLAVIEMADAFQKAEAAAIKGDQAEMFKQAGRLRTVRQIVRNVLGDERDERRRMIGVLLERLSEAEDLLRDGRNTVLAGEFIRLAKESVVGLELGIERTQKIVPPPPRRVTRDAERSGRLTPGETPPLEKIERKAESHDAVNGKAREIDERVTPDYREAVRKYLERVVDSGK